MVNIINFAIQCWLINVQKFFLVSKIKYDLNKIKKKSFFERKFFSKVYKFFSAKLRNKPENNKNKNEKTNSALCSILINDIFHLTLKKISKSFRKKELSLIIKEICLSFYHILLNSSRREILFFLLENFFFIKKFCLKFNSFVEQFFKNYFFKFLKPVIVVYSFWLTLSRTLVIFKLGAPRFYIKETIKFSIFVNNRSLDTVLYNLTGNFIPVSRTFLKKKKISQTKSSRLTQKFLYLIGIKLLCKLIKSDKKKYFRKSQNFFKPMFFSSSYPFFKISIGNEFSSFSSKISTYFSEQDSFINSKNLWLNYFIFILNEIYEMEIHNRFIFCSIIKEVEFFFALKKKLKKPITSQNLKNKIKISYWKIFFFFNFFNSFKSKENPCFISLISIQEKEQYIKKEELKKYIAKYLLFSHDLLTFDIISTSFPRNIYFQIRIFSFVKNLELLGFLLGIFQHFFLSITLYLLAVNFKRRFNLFTQIFSTLDKILNTKSTIKFFTEKKQECNFLCKSVFISLPMNNHNKILLGYQNRIFKITKEANLNLNPFGKFNKPQFKSHQKLAYRNIFTKENNLLEETQDRISAFFFDGKFQLINSNIPRKSKKEGQFLSMKIFRSLRVASRSYFKKNLRKKQLIWNFDILRILIQGSVVYCSKIIFYFCQAKNDEVFIFMSFNKCNCIFESEHSFLAENYGRGAKTVDEIREKYKFSKLFKQTCLIFENLFLIDKTFLPKCQIFKTNGINENCEPEVDYQEIKNSFGDHICTTEAILMKMLKTKKKVIPEWFIFTIKKKLSLFFDVDPRGILIQIKNLNEREYLSFSKSYNLYFYL